MTESFISTWLCHGAVPRSRLVSAAMTRCTRRHSARPILAHLPANERSYWLGLPLTEKTIRTITSRAKLERELALVAERGYAVDSQENEDEAMCVGVPIFCGPGYPVAAMSLTARTGPKTVISEEEVTQELLNSATIVSDVLDRTPWLEYLKSRSLSRGWS